ncbi:MAG: antibiotic biosynthesis monooxygenase [Chitinophagaceae bacterium]|nr:antibiotic biosynthesis monooxygenase [Chitinophagaceae bacterium]
MIATTPKPPYYAVIFSSEVNQELEGYKEMSQQMVDLVKTQPGYLGHESAREELGITVSYWDSLDSIKKWKAVSEHLQAQKFGREKWYRAYKTRICLVERDYGFDSGLF